ncbi:glucosamine-6-phosphate deaminase [Bacillus sp. FJAT-50079]|uniref:glucosamine-6-phosphate deaminase n=1 Tax=Bacillus sp. FJAT-50079 TaxID=2833577 RepID=UPI001BC9B6F7|nr:glucosamine-6-phosphate deaminase [Bacillus sp. FJAT-50079]MBS4208096.1 glucosamine-6-phosphate deaminase [Bacillus sp. FJAT-50079]
MKDIVEKGRKDKLHYYVCATREDMGRVAGQMAAASIKQLLKEKEIVRVIFASAPSQNETLSYLIHDKDIDWTRVVGFHMDEYIGLSHDSDQWFKTYLQKNITDKIKMKDFHFLDGTANPEEEMKRYSSLLNESPIDLVCLGIGENGHIAFNDPPVANFQDTETVKMVELDEYSRQQQVNDGCFSALVDVPTHALTLTIPILISASTLICTVPGKTKKNAVYKVLNEKVSTSCPATILKTHENAHLIMDEEAYGGQ